MKLRFGSDRVLGRAGASRELPVRPAGRAAVRLAVERAGARSSRRDSVVRGGFLVGGVAATLTLILAVTFLKGGDNARDTGVAAPSGVQRHRHAATEQTYTFNRLPAPDRTVVRGASGAIVATFTDGARTVSLT